MLYQATAVSDVVPDKQLSQTLHLTTATCVCQTGRPALQHTIMYLTTDISDTVPDKQLSQTLCLTTAMCVCQTGRPALQHITLYLTTAISDTVPDNSYHSVKLAGHEYNTPDYQLVSLSNWT